MEENDQITQFRLIKNGPLEIRGKFTIKGSNGKIMDAGDVVFLCRCGGSRNKPFCDGSHNVNGFQS